MSGINYETIQQYLNGELTAGEAAAFEAEMKNDPALAKEVQLYKSIDDEMKEQQQHSTKEGELKAMLQNLTGEFFPASRPKTISIKKYWWYAAAAAAAIIVALVWVGQKAGEAFDNEKLYAYYTKDAGELPAGVRGDNDTLLEKGINHFNNKEYQQALPLLQQGSVLKPDDTELYLALGYCYMQTGNNDSAMAVFNKITEGISAYKNQAYWYKALLLLKQNRIDECYAVLQQLPKNSDNYKQAEELMKKINSRKKK